MPIIWFAALSSALICASDEVAHGRRDDGQPHASHDGAGYDAYVELQAATLLEQFDEVRWNEHGVRRGKLQQRQQVLDTRDQLDANVRRL